METIIDANSPEPNEAITFASLETVKIHWNSALSNKNGKYGAIRIKNMIPGSFAPQGGEEYVGLRLKEIPTKIVEQYKLNEIANYGVVYARLNKNYGRRRTRLRAHKRFGEILRTKGYSFAPMRRNT